MKKHRMFTGYKQVSVCINYTMNFPIILNMTYHVQNKK